MARFTSVLHYARGSEGKSSSYVVQVNQALPLLLDLLLEECWDTPGTLEVLLHHLPQCDLRPVLREASETGYAVSQIYQAFVNRATCECSAVVLALIQVFQSVRAG